MYPGSHAVTIPDKPALIMGGSGEVITYRQLDQRSNQLAHLWFEHGLRRGDHVAIFMENHPRYFEVVWAALRSGLYITTINSYLAADEVSYILRDSDCRSLITSPAKADVAAAALADAPNVSLALAVDGGVGTIQSYEKATVDLPVTNLADEPAGDMMLYSSGTTGRPKGICRPLRDGSIAEGQMIASLLGGVFGFTPDTVYLSPAPIYHSAPLGFSTGVQVLGGTVIMMEKFDPVTALALVERYRVTTSQWVPTMFTRLLKLPDDVRRSADISCLSVAVHAAAPCPVEVKQAMMDWWGPILWEYYAGTELNGFCLVKPDEWLRRPGTVGRPLIGEIHIVDENGLEAPTNQTGTIYFGGGPAYEYYKAPGKTSASRDPGGHGWTTIGDVGYLDDEGWLYLTDRKDFMIISGGVNIYPQEIENVLSLHPKVADMAVIGVPDPEMGEQVKAVVQPMEWSDAGPDLEIELIAYCRERLAHYKCPRTIDFDANLPRLPTGKLYKQQVKQRYLGASTPPMT